MKHKWRFMSMRLSRALFVAILGVATMGCGVLWALDISSRNQKTVVHADAWTDIKYTDLFDPQQTQFTTTGNNLYTLQPNYIYRLVVRGGDGGDSPGFWNFQEWSPDHVRAYFAQTSFLYGGSGINKAVWIDMSTETVARTLNFTKGGDGGAGSNASGGDYNAGYASRSRAMGSTGAWSQTCYPGNGGGAGGGAVNGTAGSPGQRYMREWNSYVGAENATSGSGGGGGSSRVTLTAAGRTDIVINAAGGTGAGYNNVPGGAGGGPTGVTGMTELSNPAGTPSFSRSTSGVTIIRFSYDNRPPLLAKIAEAKAMIYTDPDATVPVLTNEYSVTTLTAAQSAINLVQSKLDTSVISSTTSKADIDIEIAALDDALNALRAPQNVIENLRSYINSVHTKYEAFYIRTPDSGNGSDPISMAIPDLSGNGVLTTSIAKPDGSGGTKTVGEGETVGGLWSNYGNWYNVRNSLITAYEFLTNQRFKASQITAAQARIVADVAALKVTMDGLDEQIARANAVYRSYYNSRTLGLMDNALSAAEMIKYNPNPTVSQVTTAQRNLFNAIEGLRYDTTKLATAILRAQRTTRMISSSSDITLGTGPLLAGTVLNDTDLIRRKYMSYDLSAGTAQPNESTDQYFDGHTVSYMSLDQFMQRSLLLNLNNGPRAFTMTSVAAFKSALDYALKVYAVLTLPETGSITENGITKDLEEITTPQSFIPNRYNLKPIHRDHMITVTRWNASLNPYTVFTYTWSHTDWVLDEVNKNVDENGEPLIDIETCQPLYDEQGNIITDPNTGKPVPDLSTGLPMAPSGEWVTTDVTTTVTETGHLTETAGQLLIMEKIEEETGITDHIFNAGNLTTEYLAYGDNEQITKPCEGENETEGPACEPGDEFDESDFYDWVNDLDNEIFMNLGEYNAWFKKLVTIFDSGNPTILSLVKAITDLTNALEGLVMDTTALAEQYRLSLYVDASEIPGDTLPRMAKYYTPATWNTFAGYQSAAVSYLNATIPPEQFFDKWVQLQPDVILGSELEPYFDGARGGNLVGNFEAARKALMYDWTPFIQPNPPANQTGSGLIDKALALLNKVFDAQGGFHVSQPIDPNNNNLPMVTTDGLPIYDIFVGTNKATPNVENPDSLLVIDLGEDLTIDFNPLAFAILAAYQIMDRAKFTRQNYNDIADNEWSNWERHYVGNNVQGVLINDIEAIYGYFAVQADGLLQTTQLRQMIIDATAKYLGDNANYYTTATVTALSALMANTGTTPQKVCTDAETYEASEGFEESVGSQEYFEMVEAVVEAMRTLSAQIAAMRVNVNILKAYYDTYTTANSFTSFTTDTAVLAYFHYAHGTEALENAVTEPNIYSTASQSQYQTVNTAATKAIAQGGLGQTPSLWAWNDTTTSTLNDRVANDRLLYFIGLYEAAFKNLVPDKTQLSNLIAEVQGVSLTATYTARGNTTTYNVYESVSWNGLQTKLGEAQDIVLSGSPTLGQLQTAIHDLNAQLAALKPNLSALVPLVNLSKQLRGSFNGDANNGAGNWTTLMVYQEQPLKDLFAAEKAVWTWNASTNPNHPTGTLNSSTTNMSIADYQSAINLLASKINGLSVNTSGLQGLVDSAALLAAPKTAGVPDANLASLYQSKFTPQSWLTFVNAYGDALNVIAMTLVTDDDVMNAYTSLSNAILGLVFADPALQTAVSGAQYWFPYKNFINETNWTRYETAYNTGNTFLGMNLNVGNDPYSRVDYYVQNITSITNVISELTYVPLLFTPSYTWIITKLNDQINAINADCGLTSTPSSPYYLAPIDVQANQWPNVPGTHTSYTSATWETYSYRLALMVTRCEYNNAPIGNTPIESLKGEYDALVESFNALAPDKNALWLLISTAQSLDKTDVPVNNSAQFDMVTTTAYGTYTNPAATVTMIRDATTALNNARKAIETARLGNLISIWEKNYYGDFADENEDGNKEPNPGDVYDTTSFSSADQYYSQNAKPTYVDATNQTLYTITSTYATFKARITGLTFNVAGLANAIARANAILNDPASATLYTQNSLNNLTTERNKAQAVANNSSATQPQIEKATTDLMAAIFALVAGDDLINELIEFISWYDGHSVDGDVSGNYTTSTWGALGTELNKYRDWPGALDGTNSNVEKPTAPQIQEAINTLNNMRYNQLVNVAGLKAKYDQIIVPLNGNDPENAMQFSSWNAKNFDYTQASLAQLDATINGTTLGKTYAQLLTDGTPSQISTRIDAMNTRFNALVSIVALRETLQQYIINDANHIYTNLADFNVDPTKQNGIYSTNYSTASWTAFTGALQSVAPQYDNTLANGTSAQITAKINLINDAFANLADLRTLYSLIDTLTDNHDWRDEEHPTAINNLAIAQYTQNEYTIDSFAALLAMLKTVVTDYRAENLSTKTQIQNAIDQLNAKVAQLVSIVAIQELCNANIASNPSNPQADIFTNESYAALQYQINRFNNDVKQSGTASYISQLITDITLAKNNLVSVVLPNNDNLKTLVTTDTNATTIDTTDPDWATNWKSRSWYKAYTDGNTGGVGTGNAMWIPTGYAHFAAAFENALEVVNSGTYDQVTSAYTLLDTTYRALIVFKNPDRTFLQELYDAYIAEGIIDKEDGVYVNAEKYLIQTFNNFVNVMSAIKVILDEEADNITGNYPTDTDGVTAAITDLTNAYDGLVVDKTELSNLFNTYRTIEMRYFTTASNNGWADTLAATQQTLVTPKLTLTEYETALNHMKTAVQNLELDWVTLGLKIGEANSYLPYQFKPSNWAAFAIIRDQIDLLFRYYDEHDEYPEITYLEFRNGWNDLETKMAALTVETSILQFVIDVLGAKRATPDGAAELVDMSNDNTANVAALDGALNDARTAIANPNLTISQYNDAWNAILSKLQDSYSTGPFTTLLNQLQSYGNTGAMAMYYDQTMWNQYSYVLEAATQSNSTEQTPTKSNRVWTDVLNYIRGFMLPDADVIASVRADAQTVDPVLYKYESYFTFLESVDTFVNYIIDILSGKNPFTDDEYQNQIGIYNTAKQTLEQNINYDNSTWGYTYIYTTDNPTHYWDESSQTFVEYTDGDTEHTPNYKWDYSDVQYQGDFTKYKNGELYATKKNALNELQFWILDELYVGFTQTIPNPAYEPELIWQEPTTDPEDPEYDPEAEGEWVENPNYNPEIPETITDIYPDGEFVALVDALKTEFNSGVATFAAPDDEPLTLEKTLFICVADIYLYFLDHAIARAEAKLDTFAVYENGELVTPAVDRITPVSYAPFAIVLAHAKAFPTEITENIDGVDETFPITSFNMGTELFIDLCVTTRELGYVADQLTARADKSALQSAIDAVLAKVEQLGRKNIKPAALRELDDALLAAQKIMNDPNATQDDVNKSILSLADKADHLSLLPPEKDNMTGLIIIVLAIGIAVVLIVIAIVVISGKKKKAKGPDAGKVKLEEDKKKDDKKDPKAGDAKGGKAKPAPKDAAAPEPVKVPGKIKAPSAKKPAAEKHVTKTVVTTTTTTVHKPAAGGGKVKGAPEIPQEATDKGGSK